MGVVVVEAVREHAVHERGILQRKLLRHADDGAAVTVGERVEARKRAIREVEARGRERSADHVDHVILEKLDEVARQLLVAHLRDESCDDLRDGNAAVAFRFHVCSHSGLTRGRADDFGPFRDFGAQVSVEFARCVADRVRARFRECVRHVRHAQHRDEFVVQPLEDLAVGARRSQRSEPVLHVVAGDARFGDGRHFRQRLRPLHRGHRDRSDLAALDMGQRARQSGHEQRHVVTHQIGKREARALCKVYARCRYRSGASAARRRDEASRRRRKSRS